MIRRPRDAGAKRRNSALSCVLALLTLALSLPGAAAELRLLRARPAVVQTTVLAPPAGGGAADTLRLNLGAGRDQYELTLRPKTHLGALAVRERTRATAYEGRLTGKPGSWVAVTRIGTRWTGIWFDGLHYYGIDSAAALAAVSLEAAEATPGSSLVYRLADVQLDSVDFTGDMVHPPQNAEALVGELGAELNSTTLMAVLITKRLQVALIGDAELNNRFGAQTGPNMLALLNVADGIFASQIGVQLQSAGNPTLFTDAANQPFTATTDSETLLGELRTYRGGSTQQRSAGLSHLMTGRDLDGNTVGIAYLHSLCTAASASLSQVSSFGTLSALVMVHEIGHVFGAPHDTEADSACASTPSGYVMGPQLNINSQMFSPCSLQQIAPVVAAAQCLADADAPDAAVETPAPLTLAVNRPADVTVTVRSVGNVSVTGVNLRISLPQSLTLVSATGPTASCSAVNNIIDCALGSIAPNNVSTVTIRVMATAAGTSNVSLRVFADADGQNSNNSTFLQLPAAEGADVAVAASATTQTLAIGGTTVATFVVENRGPATVSDARLSLTVPAGVTILQQTAENTVCAAVTNGLSCGPATLSPAATARVVLTLRGDTAGSAAIAAAVSSSAPELAPTDNATQLTLTVTSPTPAMPVTSGKGGGGKMPLGMLTGLGLWVTLRARRAAAQARAK